MIKFDQLYSIILLLKFRAKPLFGLFVINCEIHSKQRITMIDRHIEDIIMYLDCQTQVITVVL